MIDRRSFMGLGSLAMLAACGRSVAANTCCAGKRRAQFKFGMAGFSCHRLSLDETLKLMQKLDLHYLCIKDFHLPIKSTQAEIDAFKQKCADFGVTGYGVGPIYMPTNDDCKSAFDYAKMIGVKTVVAVPNEMQGKKRVHSRARCEYLSGLCAEYDVKVAIHNHGPDIPYCFPTGESAFNMVKDLDPRMGLCLDIGHDFRAGKNPAESIRKYGSRIYDMHVKNVKFDPKKNIAVPMPQGEMDLWEVVKALVEVGYTGCCSLEYESFPGKGVKPGIKETDVAVCVGYFKGLMKAVGG